MVPAWRFSLYIKYYNEYFECFIYGVYYVHSVHLNIFEFSINT